MRSLSTLCVFHFCYINSPKSTRFPDFCYINNYFCYKNAKRILHYIKRLADLKPLDRQKQFLYLQKHKACNRLSLCQLHALKFHFCYIKNAVKLQKWPFLARARISNHLYYFFFYYYARAREILPLFVTELKNPSLSDVDTPPSGPCPCSQF